MSNCLHAKTRVTFSARIKTLKPSRLSSSISTAFFAEKPCRSRAPQVFDGGLRLPFSAFAVDIWGTDVPAAGLVAAGDNDGICHAVPGRPVGYSLVRRPRRPSHDVDVGFIRQSFSQRIPAMCSRKFLIVQKPGVDALWWRPSLNFI
jgi:hypothetical protein